MDGSRETAFPPLRFSLSSPSLEVKKRGEGEGGNFHAGNWIGFVRPFVCLSRLVCLSVYALQFHRQSDAYKNTLKYMNMCFTGMFTVECILKIAAFGVRVSSTISTNKKPPSPLPSSNRDYWKENCILVWRSGLTDFFIPFEIWILVRGMIRATYRRVNFYIDFVV